MKSLCFALFAVSMLAVACNKEAEPAAVSAHPDFTGRWEGHTTYTDEQIDDLHKEYPEGDREALGRSMRQTQAAMAYDLELKDDGTLTFGMVGTPAGAMEGAWELADDKKSISVTLSARNQLGLMPGFGSMNFEVAEDGQSFAASEGPLTMMGTLTFSRPGTYSATAPEAEDPYTYAKSGELADFVGTWSMSLDGTGAMYDGMRGMMSEEDVQKQIDDLVSQKNSLRLFDDMTYKIIDRDSVNEGGWTLSADGATAVLDVPVSAEDAELMEAMGYGDMKMELRLTEDGSTLVMQDVMGLGGPVMSFKRD